MTRDAPPSRIRTPDQRLRVFVSSTMRELAAERTAVAEAVVHLHLTPILFEMGARPHPARELYRAYLEQSDVFVGIYGEEYGWVAPDMTISGVEDEYRLAAGHPKLIYVKAPAPNRDPALAALIERIGRDDVSYRRFATPDELARLVEDDLALLLSERFESAAAPPTVESTPTAPSVVHLPSPATPLIGRDADVDAVAALLDQEGVRLVTLTGPGGIGKTRLAIEVARRQTRRFADGVVFVSLESLDDPSVVTGAVARALGVNPQGISIQSADVFAALCDHLADRRLLLVLDNFEQLEEAAPTLAALLEAASGLSMLVTSRTVLRLRAEHEFSVPALATPTRPADTDPSDLASYPSVALFVDRARSRDPGFTLGAANAAGVAALCAHLDGLPLALELAAARVRVLSPEAMVRQLESGSGRDALSVLGQGPRDLPARQQTLRDTIAWSYHLLDDRQRAVFRRLGVFAGSCELPAAVAVVDIEGRGDLSEVVEALVDQSLLAPGGVGVSGASRVAMLRLVREFAVEELAAAGEADEIRGRHADYFRTAGALDELRGAQQQVSLAWLEQEHDNVRAALGHLVASRRGADAAALIWKVWLFWLIDGHLAEGVRWIAATLPLLDDADEVTMLDGLRGGLHVWLGETEESESCLERALPVYEAHGRPVDFGLALAAIGLLRVNRGDLDTGTEMFHRARRTLADAGEDWGASIVANIEGWLAARLGDAVAADEANEAALRHARRAGDPMSTVNALHELAWAALLAGRTEESRRWFAECLPLARSIGYQLAVAHALEGFAGLEAEAGRAEVAARLLGAASAGRTAIDSAVWTLDGAVLDRITAQTREALGEAAFAAAFDLGRAMSIDDAVDLALRR